MLIADMPDWAQRIPEVTEYAVSEASIQNVPWDLAIAIIAVESGSNTLATRYEPYWPDAWLYFPREHAEKLLISVETESILQKISWGPMQIMGAVAREMGFDNELIQLSDYKIGVQYGLKKLRKFLDKYPEEADVVASYNAGSPRKTSGTMYVNQGYVDKVYQKLTELRVLK